MSMRRMVMTRIRFEAYRVLLRGTFRYQDGELAMH